MNLCGRKACKSVSTDGFGASGSSRLAQWREADGGQSRWFDRGHVPAAALDAQYLYGVAEQIGHHRLDRGVAAAMQDEARIAAEQARGIDAQRQVAADRGLGIADGYSFGVGIRPQALHR